MQHDNTRERKLLGRYRHMFRFALAMAAFGVIVAGGGVLGWLAGHDGASLVLWGLMNVSLGGLCAYKVLTSTVRVLDRLSLGSDSMERCVAKA